jgi:hypothetical protein
MSSKPKGKNENVTANVAYQCAVSAMSTSKAYGILFNALLRTLLNNGNLSEPEATTIFFGAASVVDGRAPADALQRAVHQHMRSVIQEAAQGFGIQIPPPGQTGIQRTQ